jgi:hypothetical protein
LLSCSVVKEGLRLAAVRGPDNKPSTAHRRQQGPIATQRAIDLKFSNIDKEVPDIDGEGSGRVVEREGPPGPQQPQQEQQVKQAPPSCRQEVEP